MNHVFDSLETAGIAPKPVLENVRTHFENGTVGELFRGGGGGGGGGGGHFAERPGESPLPKHKGAGRGAGADSAKRAGAADTTKAAGTAKAEGEGEVEGGVDQEVLSQIAGAVRASKAIPGGGFFGGRNAALVESGDYLVTMTAGGATQRQVLRVEKVEGVDGSAVGDDEDPFDP